MVDGMCRGVPDGPGARVKSFWYSAVPLPAALLGIGKVHAPTQSIFDGGRFSGGDSVCDAGVDIASTRGVCLDLKRCAGHRSST